MRLIAGEIRYSYNMAAEFTVIPTVLREQAVAIAHKGHQGYQGGNNNIM